MSEAAQEEFTLEHKLNWAVTGGANNGCCRQLSATLQTGEWDACATDGSGDNKILRFSNFQHRDTRSMML